MKWKKKTLDEYLQKLIEGNNILSITVKSFDTDVLEEFKKGLNKLLTIDRKRNSNSSFNIQVS